MKTESLIRRTVGRSHNMKRTLLYIYTTMAGMLAIAAQAQNADITWRTPVTISGTSDVSTNGTYFASWAPYNGGANGTPVNGVTFQGFSDLPNMNTVDFDNGYNGFGSPNTSDANYNALLQYATFANETPNSLSWGGMAPGHTYLVQIWVNDGRNIGQARSETFTGGANTSANVLYGSDGSGPGQFIIGQFVADGSGSETITVNAFSSGSGPDAQINLFQVRDITTNADVAWQAPVTISGTSDVSTLGIYFGSWAPQNGSANNFPVNGVTFQGFSDLPGFNTAPSFDTGYNGYGSPNTSDANYNTLLQSARYSNEGTTPATFSWSGMTPGNTYQVQLWVNDGRNIGQARSETVAGGTKTSAALSFGSDGSGPGQYIIGTLVANASGGESLTLTGFSNGSGPTPQINLFQVRDITGLVPSGPTITKFTIHGTTLSLVATNGPFNAPFVLLGSTNVTLPRAQWTHVLTNQFDGNGGVTLSSNVVNLLNSREFYILQTQ